MPTPDRPPYASYLRYTALGFTMVGVVMVFTFVGRWLDGVVGWGFPVLTIAGALFGIVGAMLQLFRATRGSQRPPGAEGKF